MTLKSKSADLSPGLWQKSIFFSLDTHTHTTVLFWIHGHLDVLLFDGHMVVPTGGCSLCCRLLDTWLSLLLDLWTWLCDDISAKLSSAIGHWKLDKLEFLADDPLTLMGPGSLLPLG